LQNNLRINLIANFNCRETLYRPMGPATNYDGIYPSGTPGFRGSLYGMSISAGVERVVIWATACGGGGNGADTGGYGGSGFATGVGR
jgi:hypothetical protein